MPVEGRSLSSRQAQQAVRDREIGQPNNSETCSEAADGVARKSEGGSRLSLLCPVRQDQPRRYSGCWPRGIVDEAPTTSKYSGKSTELTSVIRAARVARFAAR